MKDTQGLIKGHSRDFGYKPKPILHSHYNMNLQRHMSSNLGHTIIFFFSPCLINVSVDDHPFAFILFVDGLLPRYGKKNMVALMAGLVRSRCWRPSMVRTTHGDKHHERLYIFSIFPPERLPNSTDSDR